MAQLAISHLILLHQITRASVPLMKEALEASRARPDDDVCVALAPYLERHIREECFHDQWILEDLESVGIQRAQTLSALPSQFVAALVGAQYYWVLHHHPVALIGYMIMLEANAPTQRLVGHLKAETGLPNSFFRTHLVHAELDPDHQAEILELVDRLPLSPAQDRLIAVSAMHTAECMVDCLANPKSWMQTFASRKSEFDYARYRVTASRLNEARSGTVGRQSASIRRARRGFPSREL